MRDVDQGTAGSARAALKEMVSIHAVEEMTHWWSGLIQYATMRRRPASVAVVAADTQERDTLPALDGGKAEWPSPRQTVLDGGFVADRCREWCDLQGMRHHVVARSFGWLAHWGRLLRDRAGLLDVSAARIAFVAILSDIEAFLNPRPIRHMASRDHSNRL
jgi:hypothetical protein